MPKTVTQPQESTAIQAITGPHIGFDRRGQLDHAYYRCEQCGLETTDPTVADTGCFRCDQ